MITATVTKPTTISPTVSCDRKVYFVERIDISPLYPPKSRTITLEALSRRKVAKDQARKLVDPSDRKSRKTDSASRSDPPRDSNSTAPSTHHDSDPAMSPSPSQMSFESARSSSNRHSQLDSSSQSQSTSTRTKPNDSKGSIAVKNITTQIESCVGGCLRGDSIPVRVNVNHVKHIKSMNGIIVTLYRQARVDMHPAIPLGPTEKSSNPKYEDYYPRSKTGLGGLSLSGAGSSHMFRKDLSQTVQPLIIDPGSLSSELTVRVRVPDDAFPTISTVPGAMISFKYYVEVVVDIQGKLGTQERAMAGLSGLTATITSGGDDLENDRNIMGAPGSQLVDTAPARRDKGVVTATFEVVIGTRDSERRKGKRKEEIKPDNAQEETGGGANHPVTPSAEPGHHHHYHNHEEEYWGHDHHDWCHGTPGGHDDWYYHEYGWDQAHEVPMPQLPDNSQLSEKELARRAEERLLPSQPPGAEPQAVAGASAPTAPYLPEELVPHQYDMPTPAYESRHPSISGPSGAAPRHGDSRARVPEYLPAAGPSNHIPVTDDKQEMQRRRLEAEASAPPPLDSNHVGAAPVAQSSAAVPALLPSQPLIPEQAVLEEVGDDTLVPSEADLNHDSHADAAGEIDLPKYEQSDAAPVVAVQAQGQQPHPVGESADVGETPSAVAEAAHEPDSTSRHMASQQPQEQANGIQTPTGPQPPSEPSLPNGSRVAEDAPGSNNGSPSKDQTRAPGHE